MSGITPPTTLNQSPSIPAGAMPITSSESTGSIAPQPTAGIAPHSSMASITPSDIARVRSTISQASAPQAEVTGVFAGQPIIAQGPARVSSGCDGAPTSSAKDSQALPKAQDSTSKIPQEDLLDVDLARLEILQRELPGLGMSSTNCISVVFSYLRQTPIPVEDVVTHISDQNVIQIVLSYAGDPTIQQTNDLGFKFIVEAYHSQGLLSRFFITPSDIPQGQYRQVVMDLFDRVLSLSSQPALLPGIQRALRAGAPLALSPIVEIAAPTLDLDTINVFGKIAEEIQEAEELINSEEFIALPGNAEKAARIRTWLTENITLLGSVTELDLSSLDLSSVPLEIELFTNLHMIDFSDNQLTSVPDLHLPNLQNLYLTSNQLAEVADFSHLPNLQGLYLGNNELREVPDFSHLPNLQELYLNDNPLRGVPNFSHLPNLIKLLLETIQLTEVPDFNHLQNLQELDLYDNELTEVPDFNLPNLRRLNLDNNRLTEVPDFNHLQNLRRLDLDDNPLATIPAYEQLRARGCQIYCG